MLGLGEVPISISSAPAVEDHFELCVRATGNVTNAMHRLEAGDKVGIRGPFGNGVNLDEHLGKDRVFIVGGIGVSGGPDGKADDACARSGIKTIEEKLEF